MFRKKNKTPELTVITSEQKVQKEFWETQPRDSLIKWKKFSSMTKSKQSTEVLLIKRGQPVETGN